MRKFLLLSLTLVSLGASAQIDLSLIDSVFEYVHTDKFMQEFRDTSKAVYERQLASLPPPTRKQQRQAKRSARKCRRHPEDCKTIYELFFQNTCLVPTPGYCMSNSGDGKYDRNFTPSRIYSPSGGCKDTLVFYSCFIQPDTIELRHLRRMGPLGGDEIQLRFRVNPDKTITFIKQDWLIYN